MIDDEAQAVTEDEGAVYLDLTVIAELTEELGIAEGLASKIPDGAAQLRVMDAEDLDSIRTGWSPADLVRSARDRARLVRTRAHLAGERRRETLRMVGFSFIAVGALALIAQRLAGDAVTTARSPPRRRPASRRGGLGGGDLARPTAAAR